MTALLILATAFVLTAAGLTARFYAWQVVEEILAAEQRQIDRERVRGLDANVAARWVG